MRVTVICLMLLAALGMLAGCGATTPPPAVEVRIQRVEIPVPQPCLPKDKIPDEPARIGDRLNSDPVHDLDLVTASAMTLREWGRSMHAALVACSP
jgi:hypothetical protein